MVFVINLPYNIRISQYTYIELTKEEITVKKIGIVLSLWLLCFGTLFASNVQAGPSSWAEETITKGLVEKLVPIDMAKDYQENITKKDLSTLVVAMVEKVTGKELALPKSHPFTDTEDSNMEKLYLLDIIRGSNKQAMPEAQVTREELAIWYIQAMFYLEKELDRDLINEKLRWNFFDEDQFTDIGRTLVGMTAGNGLVAGKPMNLYDPKSPVTREEAMALNVKAFYFSMDTTEILSKTEKFLSKVKSYDGVMTMDYGYRYDDFEMPMEMSISLKSDFEVIKDPVAVKMFTVMPIKANFLGLEEQAVLVQRLYIVEEDNKTVSYTAAQTDDEPVRYEKITGESYKSPELFDFPFDQLNLHVDDIYKEKGKELVVLTGYMDPKKVELNSAVDVSTIIGDDMFSQISSAKLTYVIEKETGRLVSSDIDMGDIFSTMFKEAMDGEEYQELLDNFIFRLNIKQQYKSFNQTKSIEVPSDIKENAVEYMY